MNVDAQIYVSVPAFKYFGNLPRDGITGSYGNSIRNFLRKCHTVLHIRYTILHSLQQCTRVLISPHSHQHLSLFSLLIVEAVSMGIKWYITVVLICDSLMITEFEHIFMCSLVMCVLSL